MLAGCGAMSASAQSPESPGPARTAPSADTIAATRTGGRAAIQQDDERKDGPWKSFSEVTKGAQIQSGIFTIYRKRDNAYLALAPGQLDRDYLLVTQLSQ